jgi:hypothetical protein
MDDLHVWRSHQPVTGACTPPIVQICQVPARQSSIQVPMWLIGIAAVLTLTLSFAPLVGEAQPAGKVSRVGVLSSGSLALDDVGNGRKALLERRSDLGWVVGQNLTIEPRHAEGQLDRLPGLRAELVRLKVGDEPCVREQDSHGRQTGRSPRRATHEVRVRDRPENSEGTRVDDSTIGAGARG